MTTYQVPIDDGNCNNGDLVSIKLYNSEYDQYENMLPVDQVLMGSQQEVVIESIWAEVPDCMGVLGGTAYIDDCGICSGGTSGHLGNSDILCDGVCSDGEFQSCFYYDQDDCGYPLTAELNSCDICIYGTTGIDNDTNGYTGDYVGDYGQDCNGICNGDVLPDCFNVCPGDPEYIGNEFGDGTDECGECGGDQYNCTDIESNCYCAGCTEETADNYNDGCTDLNGYEADCTINDGSCTYPTSIAINEFFYKASVNDDIPDYIELVNADSINSINLNGWRINNIPITDDVIVLPRSLFLIAQSEDHFLIHMVNH